MLSFHEYISLAMQYATTYYYATAVIGLILLIILIKKPATFFKICVVVALLVAALYVMTWLARSGGAGENSIKKVNTKTERALQEMQ